MKKTIITILGAIIILSLGIVIGMNLSKQNLNNNNNDVNSNNDENINNNDSQTKEEYDQDFFYEIISSQLKALHNKQSLNELTNQERLHLLLSLYFKEKGNTQQKNNIKVADLKEIHKNSIIKNLSVTYIDIYDSYDGFVPDEQEEPMLIYKYDESTDSYIDVIVGHGGSRTAVPIHKELVSFENEKNTYTIKYKYVFGNSGGDGPTPYELYYSGIDAYNRKNSFKKQDYMDCVGEYCNDYKTPIMEYIENNYNQIKDKLSTYTYTFKVENNQVTIISFTVE